MGIFSNIFKKKEKDNVGGMEDFMTLIRVYFQSVLASNLGISNLNALPDLLTFKRTLRVPTLNNKLGLGERKACKKLLQDLYDIDDNFFKEIDNSIKRGCKRPQDVGNYLFAFQGFTQELMMLVGNLMKWKFRIPGFLKKALRSMTDKTVHDIFTKNDWTDAATVKSAASVRRYSQMLAFSETWTAEYVYRLVTLAKKEPTPSQEEMDKAQAKMGKK